MLTRIRPIAKKIIKPIALFFVKIGASPNHITILGLATALLVPIFFYYKQGLLALLLIVLSGLFDAVDGEVARITGRKTRFGAFLDSTSDRIEDSAYIISLGILGINYIVVSVLLAASIIISYTRARAEALNVKMEGVGIIERAERIILVFVSLILLYFNQTLIALIIVYVLLSLSIITIIQRIYHVYKELSTTSSSQ